MILFLIILFFLQSFSPSYSINEFTTNQIISYQFDEQGITQVEHNINISNNFSQFYPKEYNLSLIGSKISNIQAYDDTDTISTNIIQNNNETKLSLILVNSKIGKDQITHINIRYQSNNLAKKKGKTWELSLPQFEDNLSNNINLTIKVPSSFGKLSSSPSGTIISFDSQNTILSFPKYIQKNKFILTFGEYQLFDFQFNYQIQNTTNQESIFTIPIPPDTANQKVYYHEINPLPQKIEPDIDGNWLAYYLLKPNTKIDILATGQAKIGQNLNYKYNHNLNYYSQLFWPVDNPEIISLANKYKTPRQIYDYVTSSLNYDFNRINNSSRRGAIEALKNPETSLCTDFTDLFVTIARAANIGAREIEGYAYSNNTDIKPLLPGTDILHAWPEYFDNKSQKWISIDPTWGKTTGGIDYFNDLDLNHFTFVIHNTKSDSPPPPGSYKSDPSQKSINITFAETEDTLNILDPILTSEFYPFSKSQLHIVNPNLFSLDNFILLGNQFQNIPPLSKITIDFPKTPFFESLLTKNKKITIQMSYNNQPPKNINIQNPYHFFNLLITIIFSLVLLSIGAIIVIRQK